MPLGKYLLGVAYHLLHQVAVKLLKYESIGNLGGTWLFIQAWLNIHNSDTANRPSFTSCNFPTKFSNTAHNCYTSLGEVAFAMLGQNLKDDLLATWFAAFYQVFQKEYIVWFPYVDMDSFEYPSGFRTAPFLDDESALIFVAFIKPCILPGGTAI